MRHLTRANHANVADSASAKVIVVDPRRTETAAQASARRPDLPMLVSVAKPAAYRTLAGTDVPAERIDLLARRMASRVLLAYAQSASGAAGPQADDDRRRLIVDLLFGLNAEAGTTLVLSGVFLVTRTPKV